MASLYDSASLVMIPSGVKEDKLYSIKPTDGSGDFTFSRGSDIEATRVNSSGLIEKAKENLILQSNSFNTSPWSVLGASVTSGQAGYDGTNDAWLLTDTASSGDHRLYVANSHSGVYTLSLYAKAGTKSIVYIQSYISNSSAAYFDLSDGSVLSTTSGIESKIESVANGWYRCSIAFNNTNSYITMGMAESTTRGYVGDGTGTIYIQDAQLNHGMVDQDYVETTTTAVVEGLTADLPRLDYSGGASCPSLLLEPSRTNLIDQSEYFISWSTAGTTPVFTNNYGISPEGLQNSTRVQLDNSDIFYKNVGLSQGAYVFSVFAKAISGGASEIVLRVDIPTARRAVFDLSDGTIVSNSSDDADIIDYGNGWYRCILIQNNDEIANAVIEEYSDSLDCEIYGAQLEVGSYPTSYIPTYGTAANRGADDVNSLTSATDLIGQTEGTIFIETSHIDEQAGDVRIQLSNGTSTNNWIFFGVPEATGGDYKARVYINDGGVNQVNRFGSALTAGNHKYALAYKQNDVVLYVDGELQASDTLATIPACDRLTINGASPASSESEAQNKYKQVALFKTRLTNAELAALTTL